MSARRAPWQIFAAIGLAVGVVVLTAVPAGDPDLPEPIQTVAWLALWSVLVLLGSKLALFLGAGFSGGLCLIFVLMLFERSADPSSIAVQVAIPVGFGAQFALLMSSAAREWVGESESHASEPPASPTH